MSPSQDIESGAIIISASGMAEAGRIKRLLPDNRFVKLHRSYIVNIDCIKNLAPDGIITIAGAFIPISRNIYKEVKQAYIDYSFFD